MAQSVALLAGQSGAAILLGVSTLVLARWARGRRSSRCR
jgi:DNA-binding transcriptional regulator YdaS (Cro superfamily)